MEKEHHDEETEGTLVEEADKYLITDYFYHVMKQLRICHFKEEDRTTRGGKRDNIQLGYGGLECVHCCDTPSSRKFFWSNVDRLSNSFSEIPGHVLKCKFCPEPTKKALLELKKYHPSQMTEKSRGSQKTFLRRVWRRIHEDTSDGSDEDRPSYPQPTQVYPVDSIVTLESETSPDKATKEEVLPVALYGGMSVEEAAKALARSTTRPDPECRVLLAIDQDKEWGLSDIDCFARRNLEVFCATDDHVTAPDDGKGKVIVSGQVGIRCVHCSSSSPPPPPSPSKYVAFPDSLDDLYSSVRAFKNKHLPSCHCLPQEHKDQFASLKESTSSSFGSIVRQYYLTSAEALGLRDAANGGIIATGLGGFKTDV